MDGATPNSESLRLLAPGAAPLVARRYEVEEAAAAAPPSPDRPAAPAAPALPFVGIITDYAAGQSVRIARVLSLEEDLHLADHHFVPARPVKPLAACYPVLPLTFGLEALAETAACLAPGLGLTGIEQAEAGRWIALTDSATLPLTLEARVLPSVPDASGLRIAASITPHGQPRPSLSATLRFDRHYGFSLEPQFADEAPLARLDAGQIYASRQLFHGPSLRCLAGTVEVGERDASGTLLVRAPDLLFRSTRTPQLLTDPALMDGVGQMIGIWAMRTQRRVTFPIGVGKLEYYAATPAPGTRVGIRIHTTVKGKLLSTDAELDDGAGGLWLRIADWKSWQFHWDERLLAFRRRPMRHLLSEALALPAPDGMVCRALDAGRVAGFDAALLARHYLHGDEMSTYQVAAAAPQRQQQWLLGRIAAKDAARLWARGGATDDAAEGADMPHPAAFSIRTDQRGQPVIGHWPLATPAPLLSIAHCDRRAVALAHHAPAGIDVELVAARDPACQRAYSSAEERALLADDAASLTSLWCAKEVLGKAMGTGVRPSPLDFALRQVAPDGALLMRHGPSGRQARVACVRDGALIAAVGVLV